MKTHTQEFKNNIKLFGKELDSKIAYTINETVIELGNEEINSITPHYEGNILKSVMKQLDIDSNVEIPKGTVINYKFGVKIGEDEETLESIYEYINYGNYVVRSSEKQENTNSYIITCYDKMIYSMIDYTEMGIEYPITVKDYTSKICDYLGLEFANKNDEFANYDKIIESELYLDNEGNDLGYTFRDVLDELSQVTASTICINEETDKLEIRYINETKDTIDEEYLKDVNVNFGEKYGPVNSIVLSRSAESDNIYLQDEESIEQNGLCEIKIKDNQIMNFNNRDEFLPDILEKINGLEYFLNDFSSPGIVYYNLCDKYGIQVGDKLYSCIMFNDDSNITQGLVENVYTDLPEYSETDYDKSDKTDRRINKAYIIVNKQNRVIEMLSEQVSNVKNETDEKITEITNSVQQTIDSTSAKIEVIEKQVTDGVENLKNSLVTIDINGIHVATNLSAIETIMTNDTFAIRSGDTVLAYFGYDEETGQTVAKMDNLTITNYFTAGYHRVEKFDVDGEKRTGFFFIGG